MFQLLLNLAEIERARRLTGRIVLHGRKELGGHRLERHEHEGPVKEPVVVGVRVVQRTFERVAAQVEKQRDTQSDVRLVLHAKGFAAVLEEDHLPVAVGHGHDLAVVPDIDELVLTIEAVAVFPAVEFDSLPELLDDLRVTGGGGEHRQRVLVRHDAGERHPGKCPGQRTKQGTR